MPGAGPSAWTVLLTPLLSASHPILSSTWFIHPLLLQEASITPHLGIGFLVVRLGCSEPAPLLAPAMKWSESHSVVSESLRAPLWPASLFCPWHYPGKNTGVGCHSLLRGSSQAKDRTQVSCIAGGFFTIWATREALRYHSFRICVFSFYKTSCSLRTGPVSASLFIPGTSTANHIGGASGVFQWMNESTPALEGRTLFLYPSGAVYLQAKKISVQCW